MGRTRSCYKNKLGDIKEATVRSTFNFEQVDIIFGNKGGTNSFAYSSSKFVALTGNVVILCRNGRQTNIT